MKNIIMVTIVLVALCIMGGYVERGYWTIGPELFIGIGLPAIAWVIRKEDESR